MKLYFNPQSRAVIAKWMLDECGADYQIVPIDLQKGAQAPEYLKINPAGKLPALVDGEARVFENVAICLYLADRFPEANLAPKIGAPERGRYLALTVYSTSQLDPAMVDAMLGVKTAAARLDGTRDVQDRGRARARRGAVPARRAVHRRGRDDRLDLHLAAHDGKHLGRPGDRRLRRPAARAPEVDQARHMTRVCVVGAGPAGLVSTKTLLGAGLDVDCVEMSPVIGGHWAIDNPNGRSAAYRSLETNTTHAMSRLSDFEMPADWPDFPGHALVREWFESYVDAFGFRDRIALRSEVVSARPQDPSGWRVSLRGPTARSSSATTTRSWRARATTGTRACPRSRANSRASSCTRSATAIRARRSRCAASAWS